MTCGDDEFITPMGRFETALNDDLVFSNSDLNFIPAVESDDENKKSQFVFIKTKEQTNHLNTKNEENIEFKSVMEAPIDGSDLLIPDITIALNKKTINLHNSNTDIQDCPEPILKKLEIENSSEMNREGDEEEKDTEQSLVDTKEDYSVADTGSKEISEKDIIQVKKDINRSMYNFDYFNTLNEEAAEKYTKELEDMLITLLATNKYNYYQGYNELVSVFLLVLGKKQGMKTAEIVSEYLIKDFLLDSFEKGVRPMLFMLNHLLEKTAPDLYSNFVKLGVI